jgi:hypothetical protein
MTSTWGWNKPKSYKMSKFEESKFEEAPIQDTTKSGCLQFA